MTSLVFATGWIKSCIPRCGAAFCRRAYGHTTAAERQQQRGQRRGRRQSGARASSDDISGVRISSGASCSNLRQQLCRLPRGATCWLHTGAVQTRAVLQSCIPMLDLVPRCQVSRCPPLLDGLALSTLAFWCRIVQSRDVSPNNFDGLAMSSSAFSVAAPPRRTITSLEANGVSTVKRV